MHISHHTRTTCAHKNASKGHFAFFEFVEGASPPAHQLPPAPSHPSASQHHATKHPAALRSPMCEGVRGAFLSFHHHTITCETAIGVQTEPWSVHKNT